MDCSIILPTYDRPSGLRRCLEGILRQDYPRDAFEVIVVDDGSAHPVDWVLAPYRERIHLQLRRQDNAGPAAARNAGAREARGSLLAFVDDDCVPTRGWLSALSRASYQHPEKILGGRTLNGLPDNAYAEASHLLVSYVVGRYRTRYPAFSFLPTNNLAAPREVFESLDGFDPGFGRPGGEDRDFCHRALHRGHELGFVPDATLHHFHLMGLPGFVRQQFEYGRGAHLLRTRHGPASGWLKPPSFYLDLTREALRGERSRSEELQLAGLLLVSQLAAAAGVLRASWH